MWFMLPVGIVYLVGVVVSALLEREDGLPDIAFWLFLAPFYAVLILYIYLPEKLLYRLLNKPIKERSFWKTIRLRILKEQYSN